MPIWAWVVVAVVAALVGFAWWNARAAERDVPMDGRLVTVPGGRLHVREMGAGRAVVMIHGLGGQMRNFTYSLADELVGDHRLVILDRPGSGYSTADAAVGLGEQADMIAALIAQMGLAKSESERPLVVGHSLGGAIALALTLRHPDKVGGLALLAPLTQPTTAVSPVFAALTLRPAWLRAVLAWTLVAPMGRMTQARSAGEVFGPEVPPADFGIRGGAALTMRPSAFLAAGRDIAAAQEEIGPQAGFYGAISVPVGILYGRQDRILNWEEQGPPTVAAIAGAELTLIDGGHMFPLTQPETTAAWIRART